MELTDRPHRRNMLLCHPKDTFTDKVLLIAVSFILISLEKPSRRSTSRDLEEGRQPRCLSGHWVLGLLWLLARAGILLVMKDRAHSTKENWSDIQVAVNMHQPLLPLVLNDIIRKDNLLWNQKRERLLEMMH